MKIVRVDDRYFITQEVRDVYDVALKVLNEDRTLNRIPPEMHDFAEAVCNEMDGDTAMALVAKLHTVESIAPEVI